MPSRASASEREATNSDATQKKRVEKESEFTAFLKAEYKNIAEAHFRTIESISTFFKHYLAIVSIPITALVVLFNIGGAQSRAIEALFRFAWFLFVLFLVVALVGLLVLWYIINLRMDALLYARCINAIRKHFYDKADMEVSLKLQMRVLPQSPYVPSYRERHYFWPVVFSFACLDSLYALACCLLFLVGGNRLSPQQLSMDVLCDLRVVGAFLGSFVLHPLLYFWQTEARERGYLRSHILGVDIDGVLNKHRQHFCRLLRQNVQKHVCPNDITVIPVHKCEGLEVTRDDEKQVFNDPSYWVDMPALEGAPQALRRIRNSCNLKVYIFTHRPWPSLEGVSRQEAVQAKNTWKRQRKEFAERVYGEHWLDRALGRFRVWTSGLTKDQPLRLVRPRLWFQNRCIDHITKLWLEERAFEYDKIMIERDREDVADPQAHIHNRFLEARKKHFRFFVEDDLRKANKLAFICDAVFLIDHPYNRDNIALVGNVKRVKSWEEIYQAIRALL